MSHLPNYFTIPQYSAANPAAVVQGDCYRFTVLTPYLLRIEYSANGVFENRTTQIVWNRAFPLAKYSIRDQDDCLEIDTEGFHLFYKKGEFNANSLYVDVKGNYSNYFGRWRFGDEPRDLLSTCRTLDKVDGVTELDHGICSYNGFSVMDDSQSLVMTEENFVTPREDTVVDLYYFAYGRNYEGCIQDFYRLTGKASFLPRYAMGNWWGRYYVYSDDEYLKLMNTFEHHNIPFTVAIIDMDWHTTNIPAKYGSGWTGYTWNRKLFPNPQQFMQTLQQQGYHIGINVHPSDGVRGHEEMYIPVAEAMGIDYEKEYPVKFDCTNIDFFNAYFKYLHHPTEDAGCDFWWIDWQQGTVSDMDGLDPLWMLNHMHALDLKRRECRALTFSRYAGPGSHRYGVGFSGDTYITWDSLRFQPYFTSNATNIGYTWWSHDIGGHMKGTRDEQLSVRWMQLGIFSPILRFNSIKSDFTGKEPWRYTAPTFQRMQHALRQRHSLIPYLYTMNYRNHQEMHPFITPMYYKNPDDREAYTVPHQFWFGTELIVSTVFSRCIDSYHMAPTEVWLPQGTWTDMYTGRVYRGGVRLTMYRDMDSIPVLGKAGAIVPTDGRKEGNRCDNPEELDIYVFPGGDGTFTLYEDDGVSEQYQQGNYATTKMELKWQDNHATFTLYATQGQLALVPEQRNIRLHFKGINPNTLVDEITNHTVSQHYDKHVGELVVSLGQVSATNKISVTLRADELLYTQRDYIQEIKDMLLLAEIEMVTKEAIMDVLLKAKNKEQAALSLMSIKNKRYEKKLFNERSMAYPLFPVEDPDPELLEIISEIMLCY